MQAGNTHLDHVLLTLGNLFHIYSNLKLDTAIRTKILARNIGQQLIRMFSSLLSFSILIFAINVSRAQSYPMPIYTM
jgi:hypothetical protein